MPPTSTPTRHRSVSRQRVSARRARPPPPVALGGGARRRIRRPSWRRSPLPGSRTCSAVRIRHDVLGDVERVAHRRDELERGVLHVVDGTHQTRVDLSIEDHVQFVVDQARRAQRRGAAASRAARRAGVAGRRESAVRCRGAPRRDRRAWRTGAARTALWSRRDEAQRLFACAALRWARLRRTARPRTRAGRRGRDSSSDARLARRTGSGAKSASMVLRCSVCVDFHAANHGSVTSSGSSRLAMTASRW